MKCGNCNQKIHQQDAFCRNCGAKADKSQSSNPSKEALNNQEQLSATDNLAALTLVIAWSFTPVSTFSTLSGNDDLLSLIQYIGYFIWGIYIFLLVRYNNA